jgi:PAS domain S-box-containing protein
MSSTAFASISTERILAAIAESTPDFLYAFDLTGRILFANQRLLQVWGVTAQQAAGKSLQELGYPRWHADMHMRELHEVIESRKPIRGVVPFTGGSGISGIYEYIFTPVLDARGRVEFVTGTTRDVTQRTELHTALSAERGRLAAVIEKAPAFVCILRGPEHVFEYANARYYELVGRTPDIIGKRLCEAFPEIVDQGFADRLDDVFETGESYTGNEVPVVLHRLDGKVRRHLTFVLQPVRDVADGPVTGIFVHGIDMTEQVAAHQALAERESWLRGLLEATPEAVALVAPDGELLFLNQSGLTMVGAPTHEAIRGVSAFELIAPEHRSMWQEMHRRVCSGEKLSWEFDIIGLEGTRRPMETHSVPLALPDGRTAQLSVSRDVSRRKSDERLAAHLAAIVESSDDAIVSKTLEGVIQSWNIGAQRVFGYTPDEIVGRSILTLIPPERHDEENEILARLRAGKRIDHFESVRVTKSGELIDVSLTISPVKDASGRIIAASKIARDITRQKRSERELQAAKEAAEKANMEKDELLRRERAVRAELEQANRVKDEFLATLSHELRTPLNAVLGWSQVLARSPLAPDTLEGVQIIERNARAQAQIIEDLLDMNRIISGKLRLDVQHVDLSMVISAAVETISAAAEAKGVRILTVLDPLAGPVSGDASRLQQVFWNLLSNAVKFTPRGGRVQVLLERVNSHLEVSVIDTGEGIDVAFLPHVFDRFTQAESGTSRRHSGLGLGLAIVKQLVELHGGSVRVKSGGRGTGATFTVALPVTPVHPAREPARDSERRHPAVGGMPVSAELCDRVAGVKVLVVDDEADARALIKRLLEDCKSIVVTAGSTEEAIELLRRESPDVLVSDIGMPHEDGYALIRRVRALPSQEGGDIPAIALTAYARAEDRMKAVVAGFQQHVVKPVEPAELITLVAILADPKANGGSSPESGA